MKLKDIWIPPENSEECEICEVHERAKEKLPKENLCPSCGELLEQDNFTIVGTYNGYDPEHDINYYGVSCCSKCGNYSALIPTPIIYNGNHDIYYTGNGYYLNDPPKVNAGLDAKLQNFVERVKAGENLTAGQLKTWIEYDLQHLIAEWLQDNNLRPIPKKD